MAELSDGEDIDEVEEQFLIGDAGMMPVAPPQECLLFSTHAGFLVRIG